MFMTVVSSTLSRASLVRPAIPRRFGETYAPRVSKVRSGEDIFCFASACVTTAGSRQRRSVGERWSDGGTGRGLGARRAGVQLERVARLPCAAAREPCHRLRGGRERADPALGGVRRAAAARVRGCGACHRGHAREVRRGSCRRRCSRFSSNASTGRRPRSRRRSASSTRRRRRPTRTACAAMRG